MTELEGARMYDEKRVSRAGLPLASLLAQAAQALSEFQFASFSRERLRALAQRLADQRLQVAVLGQFKRGKTSFLNALLGTELLPTAVVPVTALPIFVAYGVAAAVQIHYRDDRPHEEFCADQGEDLRARLFATAAEAANPRNRLGVARIEVFFPSPLLAGGTVFVDTPGIGSTHQHNTETAFRLLPECDAGLFVLSADPPITEAELSYLAEVRKQVPKLYFVLNKVDYLTAAEQDEAVDFLKRVLAEHLDAIPSIHCLSARRALTAKLAADAQVVQDSGLKAIEEEVIVPLGAEKLRILEQAIAAKAMSALALARGEVSLALAALRMPIDELGRRLTAFEGLLPQLDRQRREVPDLLAGDRKRLVRALEEAADKSRDRASDHFGRIIAAAASAEPARAQAAACDAVAAAVPSFFENEFEEVSQEFAVRVTEIFRPHQQRAAELIGSVRQKAADLFGIAPPVVQEVEGVELKRPPYWVSRDRVGSLIPRVAGRWEWLLPQAKKIQSLQRRLLDETMALVLKNVENLRWSSLQSLDAALRRFSGDIDRQFTQAVEATRHAIATACSQRDQEAGKVSDDVRRIEHARLMLAEIETRLRALQNS